MGTMSRTFQGRLPPVGLKSVLSIVSAISFAVTEREITARRRHSLCRSSLSASYFRRSDARFFSSKSMNLSLSLRTVLSGR